MQLLTKLILLVIALITSGLVVAGGNYFWLVRIMPDLRTVVQGFARISVPEGATNAAAEMNYFRLDLNSLASSTGTGPNPQTQSGWNINSLTNLNWQTLPQRRITSSGEVRDGSYCSSLESFQDYMPGLRYYPFKFSPTRAFFGTSGTAFELPIPFTPINMKITAPNIDLLSHSEIESGIEITPQNMGKQLIEPMTPLQSSITGLIQNSQLASAINTALSGQDLNKSSFNPAISNLLFALSDDNTYSNNMFYIPSLNSYLTLSPSTSTNSALSLVPHETFIRLGLIPGADSQSERHLNPDTWGEKK